MSEMKASSKDVIGIGNLADYLDVHSDGGYWYEQAEDGPHFIELSKKFLELIGYESLEEIEALGLKPGDIIEPEDEDTPVQNAMDIVAKKAPSINVDVTINCKGGKAVMAEIFLTESQFYQPRFGGNVFKIEIHLLKKTEAIFRRAQSLLDQMDNGVMFFERKGPGDYVTIYGNEGYAALLHYPEGASARHFGVKSTDYLYEEDRAKVIEMIEDSVYTNEAVSGNYRVLDYYGDPVWVMASHKAVKILDETYIYISFMNINMLMEIHENLENENERIARTVNNIPVGVAVLSEHKKGLLTRAMNDKLIDFINTMPAVKTAYRMTLKKEDFESIYLEDFCKVLDSRDVDAFKDAFVQARENRSHQSSAEFRVAQFTEEDITWILVKITAVPKENREGYNYFVVFQDITKERIAELELKINRDMLFEMTYHDGLTGLLNRKAYKEYIEEKRYNPANNAGVVFLDTNGLKEINDIQGHFAGDELLIKTAEILEKHFDSDLIYRISGDEFVVVSENTNRAYFENKIEAIHKDISDNEDLAAVGSFFQEGKGDVEQMVKRAEKIMRVAKQNYYIANQNQESKHRPAILKSFIEDLENGRYEMYLQPKAKISDINIIGAEALVRKTDENGKIIAPIKFVPALEKERLVSKLDFFMLEEVCQLIDKWNKDGVRDIKISVNMSRVTLAEPDYIKQVFSITDKYDIRASQLEFEITESEETMDNHSLEDIVKDLKKAGFGVSLDDMGTEYSSLRMLPMEGIDTVKLDRSFVLQIDNKQGAILIKHVIEMCHDLGQICIAEGVEDHHTRKALEDMGCDMYQGYLLAKPIPVTEFEQLIG